MVYYLNLTHNITNRFEKYTISEFWTFDGFCYTPILIGLTHFPVKKALQMGKVTNIIFHVLSINKYSHFISIFLPISFIGLTCGIFCKNPHFSMSALCLEDYLLEQN
jgi:hypothetical protein